MFIFHKIKKFKNEYGILNSFMCPNQTYYYFKSGYFENKKYIFLWSLFEFLVNNAYFKFNLNIVIDKNT